MLLHSFENIYLAIRRWRFWNSFQRAKTEGRFGW